VSVFVLRMQMVTGMSRLWISPGSDTHLERKAVGKLSLSEER
jgi:hypothetical protein